MKINKLGPFLLAGERCASRRKCTSGSSRTQFPLPKVAEDSVYEIGRAQENKTLIGHRSGSLIAASSVAMATTSKL